MAKQGFEPKSVGLHVQCCQLRTRPGHALWPHPQHLGLGVPGSSFSCSQPGEGVAVSKCPGQASRFHPAFSSWDYPEKWPLRSKSIKQTPCWLLPCFSDLSQEAHVPSQLTWVQANALVGRAENGPQHQGSVQRTLAQPPGGL